MKPDLKKDELFELIQPPSGGCVLKLLENMINAAATAPAAFGRLCVETIPSIPNPHLSRTSRLRAAVC